MVAEENCKLCKEQGETRKYHTHTHLERERERERERETD